VAFLEQLREKYEQLANFLIVYIKEAHPEDEWQVDVNIQKDVVYKQPQTFEERMSLAQTFLKKMDVKTPTLVDDIRNTANACYAAWPERIYIIDTSGTIVYKGGMGPFRFKPEEVQEFLEEHYLSNGR